MVISSRDIVRNVIFNEPTFKAYMYPRQIFIGNEKIPLSKQRMEITVHNGKLFLIITVIPVGGNNNQPKMISINFSQFRNITLKTFGNETDPPALIFHLAPASSYRILNALGDNLSNLLSSRATDLASQEYLKNTIIITLQEEPANPNENEERFMSFAINSNHQNQENAPKLEHFDMEQSFEIWKNEIQTKWTARFSERWRRTFGNQTMDFIDIIPENDFRQMMRAIGLMIKPGITQSLDYFYFDAKVKGINALFREINNYKPLEEILKLKAGEKRRAEPSPVKQPLVTVVKKLKIDKQLKPAKKVVLKMAGQKEEVSLSDDEASSSTSSGKIAKTTSTEGEDDMTYETQLFVFPPKSVEKQEYDSVVVCVKDIHTLARDEFINDVMISYKINYLINYQIDKSLRPKIYFFNTFFYSGLSKNVNTPMFSTKNGISESEKKKLLSNVDRVSKWTKKFDVFGKEYLVIPINEEFHWLVAIIVNPSGAIVETGENEEESRKKPKTWIVFLDPLTGLDPRRQKNMCSCIRYYLTGLYNKTKAAGMKFATEKPTIFDESRIEVIRPANLPVQNNYYDCGLFVLYFIEAFFCGLKPITVQDIPNMDWKNYYENGEEMADLMRDKLYNSALRLLDEAPRSRLQKHELRMKHGLSTEGTASRKHRRHSASNCLPRGKSRHSKYYIQHYSMSPPPKNLIDMPFFSNPRPMAKVPITRRVRQLRMPEEKFASMY